MIGVENVKVLDLFNNQVKIDMFSKSAASFKNVMYFNLANNYISFYIKSHIISELQKIE